MNQDNDEDEMRPEYDISGGIRGKYFRRYTESRFRLDAAPWALGAVTESTGAWATGNMIAVAAEPLYRAPRIEIGFSGATNTPS